MVCFEVSTAHSHTCVGGFEYLVVGRADVLEEEEEDSESEPEGQDVDELYHFVKHVHQQETQPVEVDVQHPALTPVLRPYQREAVNWMLQQEHFRSAPASGKYKTRPERQMDKRDYMRSLNKSSKR